MVIYRPLNGAGVEGRCFGKLVFSVFLKMLYDLNKCGATLYATSIHFVSSHSTEIRNIVQCELQIDGKVRTGLSQTLTSQTLFIQGQTF